MGVGGLNGKSYNLAKKKGIRPNMVLEVLIFLPLARATVGKEEETSLVIFL